jgi:hypothetical protein
MFADLLHLHEEVARHRHTARWDTVKTLFGPSTGKMIEELTEDGTVPADGPARVFRQREHFQTDLLELAVACVAVHAVLGRLAFLLRAADQTGLAYERFLLVRDCYPEDPEEAPDDLLAALVVAWQQPEWEQALIALVAREAASRLGTARPDPRLLVRVRRHLGAFLVLAQEGFAANCCSRLSGADEA